MKSMTGYCDHNTSAALKKLGFPTEITFIGEQGTITIPINSGLIHMYDAQKFLREEAGLHIEIHYDMKMGFEYEVREANRRVAEGSCFPSYEETLSTAIYMAIEYINNSIK